MCATIILDSTNIRWRSEMPVSFFSFSSSIPSASSLKDSHVQRIGWLHLSFNCKHSWLCYIQTGKCRSWRLPYFAMSSWWAPHSSFPRRSGKCKPLVENKTNHGSSSSNHNHLGDPFHGRENLLPLQMSNKIEPTLVGWCPILAHCVTSTLWVDHPKQENGSLTFWIKLPLTP